LRSPAQWAVAWRVLAIVVSLVAGKGGVQG
jgi:hypothetical protein